MLPNSKYIKNWNYEEYIKNLLHEMVLLPRINAIKWSHITKQTPNIKVGYPGQHLASLITGMEGTRTGARGDDLIDGTEVKSCSRVDQADKCTNCNCSVSRQEIICPNCSCEKIKRNNDSKWLFTMKSESELKLLTEKVPRVLLILADYPNFDKKDYTKIKIQGFEIWNNTNRTEKFRDAMSHYYHNIFLPNKEKKISGTPAPKNFWPYSYEFYISNPILTFSATIENAGLVPELSIDYLLSPEIDRENLASVLMPTNLLTPEEFNLVIEANKENLKFQELRDLPFKSRKLKIPFLNENERKILPIREKLGLIFDSQYSRRFENYQND